MDDRSNFNTIATEFHNECSVRRAMRLLELKQHRIYDDLTQLLKHITLLVPALDHPGHSPAESHTQLLEEALGRMEDKAFANLVRQILQHQGLA